MTDKRSTTAAESDFAYSAPRTAWKQPLTRKEVRPGDNVATCGHVEPGKDAFVFDGFWKREDLEIVFLACCERCGRAANYDIANVPIVEVISFEVEGLS